MKFPTQVHHSIPASAEGDQPAREGWRHAAPTGPVATNSKRHGVAGWIALCIAVAAATALAVSSYYDPRTLGERLDASVGDAKHQVAQTTDAALNQSAQAAQALEGTIDDAAVRARLLAALIADPALRLDQVEVRVLNGEVQLDGTAPNEDDKARAASLARATPGVRSVNNRLTVASAGR